ncbi:hypothetical protein ACRU43_25610 [Mycobacterium colombiense]
MAGNDVQLRQFLRSVKLYMRADTPLAESEQALDKWTYIACQALYFERVDLIELAIKLLHEAYGSLPVTGSALTEKRLAVVVRLYALGSLAVRLGAWETVRSIVQRPAQVHPVDHNYVHSSWIRHGHVEAARAGLTGQEAQGGYLISASRQLMISRSSMRPDLPNSLVPAAGSLAADDVLLNSLCQFDILYCLLVVAEGQTQVRSFYPSSAAFDESRADPALVKVASDATVRATLFPESPDDVVAEAIYRVVRLAMQEAFKFGGQWWGPPPSVQTFVMGSGQQEI